MEFEMVELCRRRHGKGLDSIALPSIPSHSLRFQLVVVSRGDNTVVPRTGMSLVKICVGFTSSPPPQWCDIAATSVKRDAAVVQAGGGVVVMRWRCGGD
ncbi:hypothetical protein YC2023_012339 [Brassica napus]|uniref:Uncharacterized protein n=1 Tax=Brassica oleracea TaxID=3712 RepID=A0A3P6FYW6_BRAOL|nr:unnamed protein product [Brassica oleracea]